MPTNGAAFVAVNRRPVAVRRRAVVGPVAVSAFKGAFADDAVAPAPPSSGGGTTGGSITLAGHLHAGPCKA